MVISLSALSFRVGPRARELAAKREQERQELADRYAVLVIALCTATSFRRHGYLMHTAPFF